MGRLLIVFVVLNLALLGPAVLLFRRAHAASTNRARRCRCGYNVQATPERCPECGAADPLHPSNSMDSVVNLVMLGVALVIAAIVLDVPLSLLLLGSDSLSAWTIVGLIVAALFVLLMLFLALLKWDRTPIARSKDEVIAILRRAAEGATDPGEWDYFVSVAIRDPDLDRVRDICFTELWDDYLFTKEDEEQGWFSNPPARKRLRELIAQLEELGNTDDSA